MSRTKKNCPVEEFTGLFSRDEKRCVLLRGAPLLAPDCDPSDLVRASSSSGETLTPGGPRMVPDH